MRDIAHEAGVAVQTIYASIGSKRSILLAFIDEMEIDAGIEQTAREFQAAAGPGELLDARARYSRRIYEAGIETLELLRRSAGVAPEIRETLEERDRRHHESVRAWITERWDDDVLRDDLTREQATDVIATLSGSDVYRRLVRQHGWSPDAYEAWLARALRDAVLRETTD